MGRMGGGSVRNVHVVVVESRRVANSGTWTLLLLSKYFTSWGREIK